MKEIISSNGASSSQDEGLSVCGRSKDMRFHGKKRHSKYRGEAKKKLQVLSQRWS